MVDNGEVNKILENDNGYECGVNEKYADIVIFKSSGDVVHSGRRNKDGTYNNAGFATMEYNVSLDKAARGLVDVADNKNTEFVKRRGPERVIDVKFGTVDKQGIRTLTNPRDIQMLMQLLTP